MVAKLDEERGAEAVGEQRTMTRDQHKELIRAAGRVAVEETVLGVKRKVSADAATLTAEWEAYAEIYGTNGMAAGGASSAVSGPPRTSSPDAEACVDEADAAASGRHARQKTAANVTAADDASSAMPGPPAASSPDAEVASAREDEADAARGAGQTVAATASWFGL